MPTRRHILKTTAVLTAAHTLQPFTFADEDSEMTATSPFGFCFNTSTVRGQKLKLDEQVDLVIEAGYDGIEPWIRDIQAYVDAGGNLQDLNKKLADANVKMTSAIGFARWIVDDETERTKALETAKRERRSQEKLLTPTYDTTPSQCQYTGLIAQ